MTNKRIEHRNMMRTFENKQFGSIRVLEKDSEPWFVGKDVAEVLGYERPTKAIGDHIDEQDKDEVPIQDSIGRMQNTPIINESGLYSLIFSSKLPAAKEFKHWVTSEVLPSIRKQGKHRKHRDPNTYFFRDLIGQKFGHLTVIEQAGRNKHRSILWRCICDCGNEKIYPSGKLISGRATNCGCKTTEIKSMKASKHGITAGVKPRTFTIWNGMKARCLNPKSISYKNYGGRGITICDEWMKFENFHKWAISSGYKDGYEIDRIDNDGNYCPENCHWVTVSENRKKTRNTHYITVDGTTKCVSEWCKLLHVSKSAAYKILKNGDNDFSSFCKERLSETKAV